MLKIPYDSLCLSAVVHELQRLVGSRIQKITQPNPLDIVIEMHRPKENTHLLISADAQWARVHYITKKMPSPQQAPPFCMALRKLLIGASVVSVKQKRFDRVVDMEINAGLAGTHHLIIELMGKHSNIMLVDGSGIIVNAIKFITHKQSRLREVAPHKPYLPPPSTGKPNLIEISPTMIEQMLYEMNEAEPFAWLVGSFEGISPFLAREIWTNDMSNADRLDALLEWRSKIIARQFQPVLIRDESRRIIGAYPYPVRQADKELQFFRDEFCPIVEAWFYEAQQRSSFEKLRAELTGQINKAKKARLSALEGINKALQQSADAGKMQLYGDLILTYGASLEPSAEKLIAHDYTQPNQPTVTIPLNPDFTYVENAERYYRRAKKSRESLDERLAHHKRLTAELNAIQHIQNLLESADSMSQLNDIKSQCLKAGWHKEQSASAPEKSTSPDFGGHRIRTFTTEDGQIIHYGESATANDYLTLKIAKPNDWWLHVRGGVSAHVIIRTNNNPQSIQKHTLEQAAKIAVKNSPSKHASLTAVDYTLKKYVRKPKGAPPGTVIYTHEKTIHVEL